jgi:hypothetical protein
MGGNALGVPTQRLTPERYAQVSTTIIEVLRGYYKLVQLTIPRPNKPSHGDLDILVSGKLQELDPRRVFGASVVVHNGGVTSFDYENHQIDLIDIANEDRFDLAQLFYGYPDYGMIQGMAMKSLGIKYGYQGLSIVVESHQIMLSTDLNRILEFMGLDADAWRRGFATDNEVFQFIISSRLFRHTMFKRHDDRWNHGERRALGNRSMFVAFIAYVEADAKAHPELAKREKLLASDVTAEAITFFGQQKAVDDVLIKIERTRKLKERFNGHIVMEITGLRAQELSAFIGQCKNKVSDDEWLAMTPDDARKRIEHLWSVLPRY